MEKQFVLSRVDHTELKQTATWPDIAALIDGAIRFGTASVCVAPSFVKRAAEYAAGRMRICTVIGFPNGYNTTEVKVFETACAVSEGADEIDMVVNLGMVKEGRFEDVTEEIRQIKKACNGKLLKVIIETCYLTDKEKVELCGCCAAAGADFIKTSTGFGTGGATVSDVRLFRENLPDSVKIKAAGGIKGFDDAEDLINAGADRLGTSRLVKSLG